MGKLPTRDIVYVNPDHLERDDVEENFVIAFSMAVGCFTLGITVSLNQLLRIKNSKDTKVLREHKHKNLVSLIQKEKKRTGRVPFLYALPREFLNFEE